MAKEAYKVSEVTGARTMSFSGNGEPPTKIVAVANIIRRANSLTQRYGAQNRERIYSYGRRMARKLLK